MEGRDNWSSKKMARIKTFPLTVLVSWGHNHPDKRPNLGIGASMKSPLCACKACGHRLSAISHTDKHKVPKPGCYTVCLYCGHLMVLDQDLRARNPTSTEMLEIAGDKALLEAQEISGAFRRYVDEQKKNS